MEWSLLVLAAVSLLIALGLGHLANVLRREIQAAQEVRHKLNLSYQAAGLDPKRWVTP